MVGQAVGAGAEEEVHRRADPTRALHHGTRAQCQVAGAFDLQVALVARCAAQIDGGVVEGLAPAYGRAVEMENAKRTSDVGNARRSACFGLQYQAVEHPYARVGRGQIECAAHGDIVEGAAVVGEDQAVGASLLNDGALIGQTTLQRAAAEIQRASGNGDLAVNSECAAGERERVIGVGNAAEGQTVDSSQAGTVGDGLRTGHIDDDVVSQAGKRWTAAPVGGGLP